MAKLLYGAPVAAAILERIRPDTATLARLGVTPTLAIVRIGARAGDLAYESGAVKRCGKAGVSTRICALDADATQEALLTMIHSLSTDTSVHGILLFRPLPAGFDEAAACEAIAPEKDVDGVTSTSLAGVFMGSGAGYAPCTARACMELLTHYAVPLSGTRATVVGRSLVVGRPLAMLLMRENATVTVCHTRTTDLPAACRASELLCVCAGKAELIGGAHFSPGQTVVDVGIHVRPDGTMCGDVCQADAEPAVEALTPVPGGVGSVTTAVLVAHVIEAARRAAGC